jgi:hypothetical protein
MKAVHDGQDYDQRHDAQRDAEHGDQGDEGNEVVSAFGASVAQADEQRERAKHGAQLKHKGRRIARAHAGA